jgi:isopentenyl phosphate kinase
MQQHRGTLPYGTPRSCRCIIKLGGSAITVKHQHETLKPDVLQGVVSTLRQLYDTLQQEEGKPGG